MLPEFDENDMEDEKHLKLTGKSKFPIRYLIVMTCCGATTASCFIRFSMGMAMVCMTNHTAILANEERNTSWDALSYCPSDVTLNSTNTQRHFKEDGPFIWDEALQGIILSSFFWGYTVVQIPAGVIVDKFSSKWTMAVTLFCASVLCMMIPLVALHTHVAMLIIINILLGILLGFTFTTVYAIVSRWAAKNEKSLMITCATFGYGIAQMSINYISASLCSFDSKEGWTYIFYLFGAFGVIWSITWFFIIEDHPKEHRWVSLAEQNYLQAAMQSTQQFRANVHIPWKKILYSAPVWATVYAEMMFSFRSNVIFVDLPTYMKTIMNFDIMQNGIINSVPYVLKTVLGLFVAFGSDFIIASGKISITGVRKIFTCILALATSLCLIIVPFAGCHKMTVVVSFSIAIIVDCLALIAIYINAMDLAPNYIGSLKGVTNLGSAIGNIAAPSLVGFITNNNNSMTSWNNVFYLISGLNVTAAIVFVIFGSGKVQPWNSNGDQDRDNLLEDQQSLIVN